MFVLLIPNYPQIWMYISLDIFLITLAAIVPVAHFLESCLEDILYSVILVFLYFQIMIKKNSNNNNNYTPTVEKPPETMLTIYK